MVYKTVCREDGCCEIGVDETTGIEYVLSCTKTWPSMRVD